MCRAPEDVHCRMVHEIPAREVSAADNPPASSSKLLAGTKATRVCRFVIGSRRVRSVGCVHAGRCVFVRTVRVYAPAQGGVDASRCVKTSAVCAVCSPAGACRRRTHPVTLGSVSTGRWVRRLRRTHPRAPTPIADAVTTRKRRNPRSAHATWVRTKQPAARTG